MAAARMTPKSKSAEKQKPSEIAFTGRVQHVTMAPVEAPAKGGGKKTAPVLAPFITEVQSAAAAAAPVGGAAPAAAAAAPNLSSFPHLTHATAKRAAHVTSARFVANIAGPGEGQRIDVLERFHQDDVPGSVPKRDRFIGADAETGQVHAVTPSFAADKHLPKKYQTKGILDRGNALDAGLFAHLEFEVGAPDAHSPPLSPRSRRRELPDTGYGK
jgi:hypothetical protein